MYLEKSLDMYLTIYVGMVWVEERNSSSAQCVLSLTEADRPRYCFYFLMERKKALKSKLIVKLLTGKNMLKARCNNLKNNQKENKRKIC